MQAHKISGVVMDIAAFKVSHSVDIDATALRAARARSSSIGAMPECCRKFRIQTFTCCDAENMSTRTTAGQLKGQFKGALDESSRTVQNVSTHTEQPLP